MSRSLGARPVFPHAPVGLIYVTQRFEVCTSARPFKLESFKQGICRAIDASWRAADLVIDVETKDLVTDVAVLVAVKVRTAERQPETPTTEATAKDIETLFAGFEADRASAGAALDADIHKVHSPKIELGRFGDAALQAAFEGVRITFVGPRGERSTLERAALRIPDLRLRPEVIYNFLALRAALHGDEPKPDRHAVQRLIEKYDLRTELRKRASYVESDDLERAVAPSDVASVRACAQPEAHLEDDDGKDEDMHDVAAAGAACCEAAPQMEFCGVVEYAEQGMEAVIAGFNAAIDRNRGWKLRLSPCTEVQRTQLRALGQDAIHVSFYGMHYDEEAGCLEAHVVLRNARRIRWLTGRVAGSRPADWTPVVLSAAARRSLLERYSEGADRAGDVGSDSEVREGSGGDTDSEGDETDGSVPLSHSSSTRGPCAGRAAEDAHAPPLEYERGAHPYDDYACASKALYDAWWPHFVLKRGLKPNEPLRRDKIRHLFLYFDNRFAHDMPLLFHLASVILRHAVNSAVGVRVKTNAEAFAKFQELVEDDKFLDKLDAAKRNPKGKEAREVTSTLISLVTITGKAIPWGSQERAAEVRRCSKLELRIARPSRELVRRLPRGVAPGDQVHGDASVRGAGQRLSEHGPGRRPQPAVHRARARLRRAVALSCLGVRCCP